MLAKEPAELLLVASGDRRHRLADRRPAKPQRPPLRRAERAAAHEDGRAAQVVIVERAKVRGQDSRLLEGGGRRSDRRTRLSKFKHQCMAAQARIGGPSAPMRPICVVAACASRLRITGCARCDARPRLASGPPGSPNASPPDLRLHAWWPIVDRDATVSVSRGVLEGAPLRAARLPI